MKHISELSVAQLRQIVSLKDQIEQLQRELEQLNGTSTVEPSVAVHRRRFSAAARRRMALAQQARWAKAKDSEAAPVSRKRRRMSAAGRAAIAATAQRARWSKYLNQRAGQ